MSERNPTIPFGNFSHPPLNLPEIMENHGCANATDLNVMHALFRLVQFHKTERVGKYDLFIGDTCVVSHTGLAASCFFNEKTIRRSIERLKEAGLITQHKQGTCFWYHITIYDTAIDYLKHNPNHPMETTPSPVGSEAKRKKIYTDSVESDSDSVESNSDTESDRQESLQEDLQESPTTRPGNGNSVEPTTSDEKRGDSLNLEKQEDMDVAPNREIGEFVDSLTKNKGMTKDKDEGLDAFMNVFKPIDGIVWTWKDQQPASKLRDDFLVKLSAASLNMPPILFFRRVMEEVENRVMDGKIERPMKFGYFLTDSRGLEIIDFTLERLKSENSATRDKERTDDYLADLRARSKAPVEIPEAARKMLDKIYGGS